MFSRLGGLRPDVPVTFIYGAQSWMDVESGHEVQKLLPDNHVEVYVSNVIRNNKCNSLVKTIIRICLYNWACVVASKILHH